jgi:replicative DNA helicase
MIYRININNKMSKDKIFNIHEFNVHNINPKFENIKEPSQGGSKIVVIGKPGCFARGTKVLMYNGSYKKVEDVVPGDILMGDDSQPRNVLELCRNVDDMYKIIPKIGKSITVNKEHILSLISTKGNDKGELIDITLSKFLTFPEKTKQKYHWYRTSVDYEEKKVFIDPYIYGFFLDGDFGFIKKQFIKTQFGIKDNVIDSLIDKYMDGIHDDFLINCKDVRLKLLAGIIDSQSTYNNITRRFTIEPSSCQIAKQVISLSNSLGFYSSKIKNLKPNLVKRSITKVYTCYIYANTNNMIPSKIYKINYSKVLFNDLFTSEFRTEFDGHYEYFGFTVDGNHRFLLKSITLVSV